LCVIQCFFSYFSLGDSLTSINNTRYTEFTALKKGSPPELKQTVVTYPTQSSTLTDITNLKDSTGNITALTEKLRKGLDVRTPCFILFKVYLIRRKFGAKWQKSPN